MSIRNRDKGYRKFSISRDRGVNWGESYLQSDIKDPACNGEFLRYSSVLDGDENSMILHTIPFDSAIRQNVSILLSYDEGVTWSLKKRLCSGLSAYSSMAVLSDGTIGVIVEEGKWDSSLPGEDGFQLWFMRFSLDTLK